MEIPNIYFPNLKLAFYIDEVAFSIFGIPIYWYGIVMSLAVGTGYYLACYIARKEGLAADVVTDFVVVAIIPALIGARAFFVCFHWSYYAKHPIEILNTRQGGMAIYGAVIASLIVAVFYTHMKKVHFLQFADVAVYGLLLGQVIGRYGNFFNREAYGDYTEGYLAMDLLKSSAKPPFSRAILMNLKHLGMFDGATYIQVHPTFLYESIWNFILLLFLLWYREKRTYSGTLFFIYLVGYGVGRFWIEGLRTDQLLIWGTTWPISQGIAIISIIMGIIGIKMCRKEKVKL